MVDLPNPEEVEPPPDTPYFAQDNNRTDEEVEAEITTLVETPPGAERSEAPPAERPAPDAQQDSPDARDQEELEPEEEPPDSQVAAAPSEPEPSSATRAEPSLARSEIAERGPPNPNRRPAERGPGLDLSVFNPDLASYQAHLAQNDLASRQRIERSIRANGYLGGDDQADWERTRAALENMTPEVRSGTETRLNTRRHAYAAYLAAIHRRIHAHWAEEFLIYLDFNFGPGAPLSNPHLEAVLEIVLGSDGTVERVNLVRTSGLTLYDAEAINTIYDLSPFQPPPRAIRSDNGNTYIHWSFWRDQRMCGTFGASVHRVQ
jgi:hypothetical protein